jgi:hypothetical protein
LEKEKIFNSLFLTLLLFLFQIYFGIIPGWKKITSDFPNYYVASKMLSDGQDLSCLYDNNCFNEKIKRCGIGAKGQFALYPPSNALVMLPLASFDPLIAKRIWLLINIVLLFVCAYLIKVILNHNFIFSLNILLLSGFSLANDLFLGQIYLFLLILLLTGYIFYQQNNSFLNGLTWGSVLALKYAPVIFLPSLVLKRKWKIIFTICWVFLIINLLCLFFFGMDLYSSFIMNHLAPHLQGNLYEGNPLSIQYQSWDALLNNLFIYDLQYNLHPLINSAITFIVCKSLIWLGILGILSYFYKKSFHTKHFFEITFSLSMISLLLLEPGSATYHNLFLILPLIIILKLIKNKTDFIILISLFSFIGILPSVLNKLSLFSGQNLFLSFNRLWIELIFYTYTVYLLHKEILQTK